MNTPRRGPTRPSPAPAARPAPARRVSAPAPAPAPARTGNTRLIIIAGVVIAAVALLGYGMSRPSTPWAFDQPDAQKPFHR